MVGFIREDNYQYAGRHVLIDLYGCYDIDDPERIKILLSDICKNLGATVLYSYAHEFDGGGSSGVIILAESHCTWHHWLSEGYIALDIFVCGNCQPQDALDDLITMFKPTRHELNLVKRGTMPLIST